MKKDKMRFLLKVIIAHMVTYFICGAFFSLALNYEAAWQTDAFYQQMRDYRSIWITLGPFLQIFRGLLFGGILLLIPKDFFQQKLAWLKLWIIVAGIGILNTPGPGGGSIEGLIYTDVPWLTQFVYSIEIYVQTLWFSWWICRRKKERHSLEEKVKYPLIAAVLTFAGTSLSGVVIAVVKSLDPMDGSRDIGAMITLFFMGLMMFLAASWYRRRPERRSIAFVAACYLINALPATLYGYVTASPFASPFALVFALVPTFFTWLFMRPRPLMRCT